MAASHKCQISSFKSEFRDSVAEDRDSETMLDVFDAQFREVRAGCSVGFNASGITNLVKLSINEKFVYLKLHQAHEHIIISTGLLTMIDNHSKLICE